MIFGAFFNLIPLSIVGFGLFLLVKKENMEQDKIMTAEEKGNEKVNPAFHLFLYLSMFFSLGFLIGGMLTSLFQFVNKYIPDLGNINEFNASVFDDAGLKIGISMLLVASLVYFVSARIVNKKLVAGDIRPDSLVRKFLTYIALFILVAISIGSLVALIFNYLNGNLTGNSFGKISAFFLVNGFFAAFYFWEIRRKEFSGQKFDNLYYCALAVIAISFVSGIIIADSPQVTREKKIDQNMVNEIQNINSNVEIFFANNKRLPKADEIQMSAKFPKIAYGAKGEKLYELCGEFLQAKESINFYDKQWNHPIGKHCFKINIDERQVKGEIPMQQVVQ